MEILQKTCWYFVITFDSLEKQLPGQASSICRKANGLTINQVVKKLLNAHDPDTSRRSKAKVKSGMMGMPQWNIEKAIAIERQKLIDDAVGFLYS
jgi:type I restriction enzyme R subunit